MALPFQPAVDVAEVVIRQRLFDNEVNNVLHYYRAGGYNAVTLQQLCVIVEDAFTSNILPFVSNNLSELAVTGRDLGDPNGVVSSTPAHPPITGGVPIASLPGNVAFCLTKRTASSGRSGRGRMYIAGLSEADVTGNTLSPSIINGLVAGAQSLIINPGGSGYTMVVLQRFAAGVRLPGAVERQVTLIEARDNRVDSQRGRLD